MIRPPRTFIIGSPTSEGHGPPVHEERRVLSQVPGVCHSWQDLGEHQPALQFIIGSTLSHFCILNSTFSSKMGGPPPLEAGDTMIRPPRRFIIGSPTSEGHGPPNYAPIVALDTMIRPPRRFIIGSPTSKGHGPPVDLVRFGLSISGG